MPSREVFTPSALLELAGTLSKKVEALPEPGPGTSRHDLVIVVKSLMRGMIMQGRAFAAVCAAGLAWAAGSNLRSMFEVHLDIRFLLGGSDPERLARRIVLYAMKDMAEYEPSGNSALLAAIDGFRRLDPTATQEFEDAWKKNKGHWSGRSRTTLMETLEPTSTDLQRFYKGYSWGSHMVLEPVLDYDWSEGGDRRRENRRSDPTQDPVDCTPAADLLRSSWVVVSTFFGAAT
jgi:ATPase related to the helicase subunit of the Holliday junction resolvase